MAGLTSLHPTTTFMYTQITVAIIDSNGKQLKLLKHEKMDP